MLTRKRLAPLMSKHEQAVATAERTQTQQQLESGRNRCKQTSTTKAVETVAKQ
jgi:hypothetical protein